MVEASQRKKILSVTDRENIFGTCDFRVKLLQ